MGSRALAALTAVVALAVVGGLVWFALGNDGGSDLASPSPSATPTASGSATASADPDPAASNGSDVSPEPGSSDDSAAQGPLEVPMSLTRFGADGGTLTAAAIVSDVVEDDGTCTLVLSDGEQQLSVSAAGVPSATTTSCAQDLTLDVSALSGTWELWITYESPTASGLSDSAEIDLS